MKGRSIGHRRIRLYLLGLIIVWAAASANSIPPARDFGEIDMCEQEARKAYAQVLKLCRLAETDNPRLKCFEAAKAAYFQTLENCRRSREQDRGPSPPPAK